MSQEPSWDAGLQPPGVGAENTWGELGKCLSTSVRRRSWRPPVQATPEHPSHPACPAPGLSSLPPEALTISQEVGGGAEGPRGQVPGQPLQLAQQAFHFGLQVLHRLLHRLSKRDGNGVGWGRGAEGTSGAQSCFVRSTWCAAGRELAARGPGPFLFSLCPARLRVP